MITVGVLLISSTVLNYFQKSLIKTYKDKLDKAYNALDKEEVITKYCLANILKNAIEREDFEQAKHCQDLLSKFDILQDKE
jgi:hypothetical protein